MIASPAQEATVVLLDRLRWCVGTRWRHVYLVAHLPGVGPRGARLARDGEHPLLFRLGGRRLFVAMDASRIFAAPEGPGVGEYDAALFFNWTDGGARAWDGADGGEANTDHAAILDAHAAWVAELAEPGALLAHRRVAGSFGVTLESATPTTAVYRKGSIMVRFELGPGDQWKEVR